MVSSISSSTGLRGSPPRIALLTPYTGTNLGDAAIFEAAVRNLRERRPDAELVGLTLLPHATQKLHGIICRPSTGLHVPMYSDALFASEGTPTRPADDPDYRGKGADQRQASTQLWRVWLKELPLIRAAVRGCRNTLHWLKAWKNEIVRLSSDWRAVRDFDAVFVCGGGQLDDEWGGPWGQPYVLARWAVLCQIRKRGFCLLSVGVCRLERALSWRFLSIALRRAAYRSYRDLGSRQMLSPVLEFTVSDPCVDDLAFSLPIHVKPRGPASSGSLVIGLSPIAHGRPGAAPTANQAGYLAYLDAIVGFVMDQCRAGHVVRVFSTTSIDRHAIGDLRKRLVELDDPKLQAAVRFLRTESLDDLLVQLADIDIVVASRLHGVILAHHLGRPTVAVSYDRKVEAQMHLFGQESCLLSTASVTRCQLNQCFANLSSELPAIHDRLLECNRVAFERLASQYETAIHASIAATGQSTEELH